MAVAGSHVGTAGEAVRPKAAGLAPAGGAARGAARGAVLLLGGLVVSLLVQPVGSVAFYFVPVITGATYLLAAAAGGRSGPLWAPGIIVLTWGTGVALVLSGAVHADFASVDVTSLGVGAALAVLATRWRCSCSAAGVALSVLLVGVMELAATQAPALFARAYVFGLLLGLWGLVELLGSARRWAGAGRSGLAG